MLAQDSYQYIKIGLAIRLLRNVTTGHTGDFILNVEEDLKTCLAQANFTVSTTATGSIDYGNMIRALKAERNQKSMKKPAKSSRDNFLS